MQQVYLFVCYLYKTHLLECFFQINNNKLYLLYNLSIYKVKI